MKACKRIVASLAVVALGYGTAAQAASVYNNIVSSYGAVDVYHMDEASGTTMTDSVASNNGIYGSPGVTLSAVGPRPPAFPGFDPANNGAQFDGSSTGEATIGTVSGLSPTLYSMVIWFNYDSAPASVEYLVGRGSGASLSYDSVGISSGSQLVYFDGVDPVALGGFITTGVWHNLVFTRNGSTVNVYLDGVNEINTTASATFGASTRITVAERPGDTAGTMTAGVFDELSLYNTELTQAQVTTLFSTVPEPSAALLLGLGSVSLLRRKRHSGQAVAV